MTYKIYSGKTTIMRYTFVNFGISTIVVEYNRGGNCTIMFNKK